MEEAADAEVAVAAELVAAAGFEVNLAVPGKGSGPHDVPSETVKTPCASVFAFAAHDT